MLEFSARSCQKLKVTNRQMEIIMGCLLGDAYIHPRGQIQIEHSLKQFPYLNWKYKELCSLAYGFPSRVERFDQRYQKTYSSNRFWLRQFFRPLRLIFYPKGKKIFPKGEILKYFTNLSLAVWHMDEGNLSNKKDVKIATDGFDKKSLKKIQNFLLEKFGLKSTIQSSGKLRIRNESLGDFFKLIKPHIHPSMKYKIP